MRVLVCVKRVPAPGAKINVTPDGQSVDTANLGFTMSPHEECGVELAVQLVEQHGGESHVLTLGVAEADEQCRYAASIGVNKATLVSVDAMDWDPQRTAVALTEAIRAIETDDGAFDLIVMGNESADTGGYQVGIRVARALGRPVVNGLKGVELSEDGSSFVCRREIDAGSEIYELPLPAVVGVKEGITWPRYPTMRGRLASKKLDVSVVSSDEAPGGQSKVRLVRPEEQVSETVVLGEGPEAAEKIVELLKELGLWPGEVSS
ncbi:electron transfer flavoprotein subunit beta/FixA family protein [Ilumatobacter sp.]|uniref:electron transfer flavoprotein subunit beta/FixA family protein n=1 Tax=Ilumatobacter sp. TaxID=1967498 RepID=UPI003AF4EC45